MPFSLHIPDSAQRDIDRVPLPWRERIYGAIDHLKNDPWYGEKMLGEYKDKYKIRVWPYRIIYRFHKKIKLIEILEVGNRGGMGY